jgi:hypothetical protein
MEPGGSSLVREIYITHKSQERSETILGVSAKLVLTGNQYKLWATGDAKSASFQPHFSVPQPTDGSSALGRTRNSRSM